MIQLLFNIHTIGIEVATEFVALSYGTEDIEKQLNHSHVL